MLIIDGDEWVARLLADGLRDQGFDVSICDSGASALASAQSTQPDCVLTEIILPELDGVSVARSIRMATGSLAAVPIIFISYAEDLASKIAAFAAGGDVFLAKPFRVEDVALQVDALVTMTRRLRGLVEPVFPDSERDSMVPGSHAIEGNIAQMSVATVLTLFEMERRSGRLKVSCGNRTCRIDIVAGYAVGGAIGGSPVAPLAALREILRWKTGRFRFSPSTEGGVPNNRRSIGALLIEAVRLDDESAQARGRTGGDDAPPPSGRSRPTADSQPLPQEPSATRRRVSSNPSPARRASRLPPPPRPSALSAAALRKKP